MFISCSLIFNVSLSGCWCAFKFSLYSFFFRGEYLMHISVLFTLYLLVWYIPLQIVKYCYLFIYLHFCWIFDISTFYPFFFGGGNIHVIVNVFCLYSISNESFLSLFIYYFIFFYLSAPESHSHETPLMIRSLVHFTPYLKCHNHSNNSRRSSQQSPLLTSQSCQRYPVTVTKKREWKFCVIADQSHKLRALPS